jgi:hypothetical protein
MKHIALALVVVLLLAGCMTPYKGPYKPMDGGRVYSTPGGITTVYDANGNAVLTSYPPVRRLK